jgi:hypothetical protein
MTDQPSTSHEELNTSAIALVGVVSAILIFAIIVLVTVVFYRVQSQYDYRNDISQRYVEVSETTARQRGRLAGYGWVNQEKGIVHVPIERAIELVLDELAADPVANVTGVQEEEASAAEASEDAPPAESPEGGNDEQ